MEHNYLGEQYWEGRVRFWRMLAGVLFFTPIIGTIQRGCDSGAEYMVEKRQQKIINSIPEAKKLQENYLQVKNSLDSRLALTTTVYYYNLNKILEEHKVKQDSTKNAQEYQIKSLKMQADSLELIADSLKKTYK